MINLVKSCVSIVMKVIILLCC